MFQHSYKLEINLGLIKKKNKAVTIYRELIVFKSPLLEIVNLWFWAESKLADFAVMHFISVCVCMCVNYMRTRLFIQEV